MSRMYLSEKQGIMAHYPFDEYSIDIDIDTVIYSISIQDMYDIKIVVVKTIDEVLKYIRNRSARFISVYHVNYNRKLAFIDFRDMLLYIYTPHTCLKDFIKLFEAEIGVYRRNNEQDIHILAELYKNGVNESIYKDFESLEDMQTFIKSQRMQYLAIYVYDYKHSHSFSIASIFVEQTRLVFRCSSLSYVVKELYDLFNKRKALD